MGLPAPAGLGSRSPLRVTPGRVFHPPASASLTGAVPCEALGVLGASEVEDLNAVVVGDAQRLPGPANALAATVKAAVRCPAQHEAHRARQVRAEHLMAVTRVQAPHLCASRDQAG